MESVGRKGATFDLAAQNQEGRLDAHTVVWLRQGAGCLLASGFVLLALGVLIELPLLTIGGFLALGLGLTLDAKLQPIEKRQKQEIVQAGRQKEEEERRTQAKEKTLRNNIETARSIEKFVKALTPEEREEWIAKLDKAGPQEDLQKNN